MKLIPVGTRVVITGPKPCDRWCWTRRMDKFIGEKGIIAKAEQYKSRDWLYQIKTARGDKWLTSNEGIPYTFTDDWFTEE